MYGLLVVPMPALKGYPITLTSTHCRIKEIFTKSQVYFWPKCKTYTLNFTAFHFSLLSLFFVISVL